MRNSPLRGLMRKTGEPSKSDGVRTDSTTRFDPITHKVDSTPVGHRKVKASGYGYTAAIDGGNERASMWKNKRDDIATKKVTQSNKEKSRRSEPGSSGMKPIMPGE